MEVQVDSLELFSSIDPITYAHSIRLDEGKKDACQAKLH